MAIRSGEIEIAFRSGDVRVRSGPDRVPASFLQPGPAGVLFVFFFFFFDLPFQ